MVWCSQLDTYYSSHSSVYTSQKNNIFTIFYWAFWVKIAANKVIAHTHTYKNTLTLTTMHTHTHSRTLLQLEILWESFISQRSYEWSLTCRNLWHSTRSSKEINEGKSGRASAIEGEERERANEMKLMYRNKNAISRVYSRLYWQLWTRIPNVCLLYKYVVCLSFIFTAF